MASVKIVNVDEIKSKLLHPATTSHFVVSIPQPNYGGSAGGFVKYLRDNGVTYDKEKLELLCCEAILPGSQLATHSITGDYHGSTHKHAYRRQFDDRIDLSFYVDADNYLAIRYFETWIKYIVGESFVPTEKNRPGVKSQEYFYRMNYPVNYIAQQDLSIIKFEKSTVTSSKANKRASQLMYSFVDAFPISINSMSVSYDTASLLKCSVAFSYVRYYIDKAPPVTQQSNSSSAGAISNPFQQANTNNATTGFTSNQNLGVNVPATTTNGINLAVANASGNTVQTAFSGRSII